MATPQKHAPALLLAAIFSRHESALDWAAERIRQAWGELAMQSRRFAHDETNYYEPTMGRGLKKQFLVVDGFYDAQQLPQTKLLSNAWEDQLASEGNYTESRPLNVDPGYLTLTKLVLASAKDRAHRLYMADGIYAEECLYYVHPRWHSRPWTYPDYQREDFQVFFSQARSFLKQKIEELPRA